MVYLGLAVIALAAILLSSHARRRREDEAAELSNYDREFLRKQFVRRRLTSSLLLVLGMALAGGDMIRPNERPVLFLYFWLVVLGLALVVLVFAAIDAWANSVYLRRQQTDRIVLAAKLKAELEQAQRKRAHDRNGAH